MTKVNRATARLTGPVTRNNEWYRWSRKTALIFGCFVIALCGLFQFKGLDRDNLIPELASIRKAVPTTKFQLDSSDSVSAGRTGDKEDAILFSVPAPHLREGVEFKDNLKWYSEDPASKKYLKYLEWHRYSAEEATSTRTWWRRTASKRLLIAQYSNHGEHAEVYELTKEVNMAYAKRWNHDIVFLNASGESTRDLNLATLLRLGWESRDNYDQLLLLDADAMMNNFRNDITVLLPPLQMMAAKRVVGSDLIHTWNIFDTVSLWNLSHQLVPRVQITWSSRYMEGDDKANLALQIVPYAETEVFTVTKQIGHEDYVYIKTLQFSNREVNSEYRLKRWRSEVTGICKKERLGCRVNEKRKQSKKRKGDDKHKQLEKTDCVKRQQPTWGWRKIGRTATSTAKRLLIAQYSSNAEDSENLKVTSSINKLYAGKLKADFVSVQGNTLILEKDGDCEPPDDRAMYNKLSLLQLALKEKNSYDYLLLLDSDAIVYDLDYDVTSLLQSNDLLVAQRDREAHTHTSDIYGDIMLWNLNHPMVQEVADEWMAKSRRALEEEYPHDDEYYLKATLHEKDAISFVRGITKEIQNKRGTVIRHFPDEGTQKEDIQLSVKEVCDKFPADCKHLDKAVFLK